MQKKTPKKVNKSLERAVAISSKMEGLSLAKAKKDKATIKILQRYGILSI